MEVKGEWTASTAGGSLDQPSWRSNTQYILKDVEAGQTVTITVKLVEADPKQSVGFAIVGKAGQGRSLGRCKSDILDNAIVTTVTDDEGHLNVVHTTAPKKGQTEGIIDSFCLSSQFAAQHQFVVSAQELPYRVIPTNGLGITGPFVLSTSVGQLVPVQTHYQCASMEVSKVRV